MTGSFRFLTLHNLLVHPSIITYSYSVTSTYKKSIETPNGIIPKTIDDSHPVLKGIDNTKWTDFLGHNTLTLKQDAALIATIDEDVFMAARECGRGRTFAFASDCVPHWAPPEFSQWDGYAVLFSNIVRWLAGEL